MTDMRPPLLLLAALLAAPGAATAADPAAPPTEFARIDDAVNGTPRALQLAIVSYAPRNDADDLSVDLVAAVHIGDKAYYDALDERFRAYDAVLYELVVPAGSAVTERQELGMGVISGAQAGMKNLLGLAFQLDEIDYAAANFVHADMDSNMLAQSMSDRGESLYVYFWRLVFASIDDYSKDPFGLKDWQLLVSTFSYGRQGALKIAIAREMVDASNGVDFLGGTDGSAVIAARNEHALQVLKERIATGDRRIGIFYGAAHMLDFERRLVEELELEKTGIEWVDAWLLEAPIAGGEDPAPQP